MQLAEIVGEHFNLTQSTPTFQSLKNNNNQPRGATRKRTLFKPQTPKPMNHETKATLKAALGTGYILLVAMFCIAYFGRFIFALITN
jgi:hypothetical protein